MNCLSNRKSGLLPFKAFKNGFDSKRSRLRMSSMYNWALLSVERLTVLLMCPAKRGHLTCLSLENVEYSLLFPVTLIL